MMLYVNGQDIARLVLGLLTPAGEQSSWKLEPEAIACAPEGFLAAITAYLATHQVALSDLTGLVLISGPGSPTALRASHAIANALSFTAQLPIHSLEKDLSAADVGVTSRLANSAASPFAFPSYGTAPTITTTKRDALRRAQ